MRQHGVLTRWNDARGFGFIEPLGGSSRLFVHVSEFPSGRRPVDGVEVTYVVGRDERGRPSAEKVRYRGVPRASTSGAMGSVAAGSLAVLFLTAVAALVTAGELPAGVLAVYGILSLAAFGLYGADKSAARRGDRRVSESTLHTLDLLGGWPGALVAQQAFRHKTIKQPFRSIFWLTVVVNGAALGWWAVYR